MENVRRNLFGNGSTHIGIPPSPSQGMMPDKFDGKAGFKTWQKKMCYYLASMNMERYLTEDPPTLPQGDTDVYVVGSMDSWAQGDYCCKIQILNRLVNDLYDLYNMYKTSKALWLALETKYKTDESGMQKFSTTKFLNFKMVDSKPIMEQVEARQRIFQEINLEGMSICNVFKTNCLIEKLPPVRSNFKHYINFKRKGHDVHVAEHKVKLKSKGRGISIPHKSLKVSSGPNFKKSNLERKFKGKCHHFGKIGHKAEVCKSKAKDLKLQANLTEEDMVAVVTECNLVDIWNPVEWFYDTGATRHICTDRTMFTTYEKNKLND
ncbi:PREDICTED: uncharacterized protein LOC104773317 [Camelina sativa]|uniref:Uncharacterized protein LOC104773317 n=1 Tax=Camelina sativa TaxID=90675 RepID=A0ABM0Y6A0_CAMSA|nr:PREDICTED: uncharacterized protein LOC104773317 [Camelina sativa]